MAHSEEALQRLKPYNHWFNRNDREQSLHRKEEIVFETFRSTHSNMPAQTSVRSSDVETDLNVDPLAVREPCEGHKSINSSTRPSPPLPSNQIEFY